MMNIRLYNSNNSRITATRTVLFSISRRTGVTHFLLIQDHTTAYEFIIDPAWVRAFSYYSYYCIVCTYVNTL